MLGYPISIVERVGDEFISERKTSSHELVFGIEKTQDHLTLISEPMLSISLGSPREIGLSLL